jgi:phosphatidylethanolamine-binding protein (PEBP) family uncharacterized protein
MANQGVQQSTMAGTEQQVPATLDEQKGAAPLQGQSKSSLGPRTSVEESSQTERPAPSTATTSATNQGTLISELEAAEIIPDVLDTFNPSAKLNLVFATEKGTLQIENGERYAASDLRAFPMLTIHESFVEERSHMYTVALVDLDAPNPMDPKDREYLHWLVTNIPGPQATSDSNLVDPAKVGKVVAAYEPIYPEGDAQAPHRYAFVLFRQRPSAVLDIPATGNRRHFKTRDFLMSNAVVAPVSAGYFTSSH